MFQFIKDNFLKVISCFAAGSGLLSLLLLLQELYFNHEIQAESFIVPVICGGCIAVILYYLIKKELHQKVKFKNKKYRKLFNNINSGVAIYEVINEGEDFIFLDMNLAGQKIENVQKSEIIGESIKDVFPSVEEFGLLEVMQTVYKTGEPEKCPVKKYKDNRISGYRENYVYKLPTGEIVAVYDDLTVEKRKEEELKQTKKRLELAIEGANLGLWDWNNQTDKVKFNSNWAEMLGYELDEIEQSIEAWEKRIHDEDRDWVFEELEEHLKGETEYYETEHRLKTKEGTWKWIKDIGKVVARDENGKPVRAVGIHQDIDNKKRAQQRIKYLSFHDELTDLYNRRYFENELKRLNNSRQLPMSIIVVDLDGLKYINDNYGHQMGDKFIRQTGEIFNSVTRATDIVARVGGDEFAVILPGTNAAAASKICSRVKKKCKRFNQVSDLPEDLAMSLGSATMKNKQQKLAEIFNEADKQMYANKNSDYRAKLF